MAISLVAEIGINHNGSIDIAKLLIDAAVRTGFNYVKFQKRTPDVCVPEKQKGKIVSTPWGDIPYIDYKKKIEFGHGAYAEIDEYCKRKGIGWFASVWDYESALFMHTKGRDIVKIPSALITDLELLRQCRKLFKTVIMSTGMSDEKEIELAVSVGNPDIIMHSVSAYPTENKDLNLRYLTWLEVKYNSKVIGYSGHERGIIPSIVAAGIGAEWIERHITLNKTMWGSDQAVSIDTNEMELFVKAIRDMEEARNGFGERKILKSEKDKRVSLRK